MPMTATKPVPEASEATCATCPHFIPPRTLSDAARAAVEKQGIGAMYQRGRCVFMPETFEKRPEEWCGQHPERKRLIEGGGAV